MKEDKDNTNIKELIPEALRDMTKRCGEWMKDYEWCYKGDDAEGKPMYRLRSKQEAPDKLVPEDDQPKR